MCLLLLHVKTKYSAGAYTSAMVEVRSVDGLAPHPVPTSLQMSALCAMTLLWVLQEVDGRRVSCQAWCQGKWLWAESLNALCQYTHLAHISVPCCSDGRLLRLSYPHSVSVATASGIGPRCSCPGLGCFQSSSIPGGLFGWPSHQHRHISWRWYQGGHGCRCWTAMGPGQIPGDTVLKST